MIKQQPTSHAHAAGIVAAFALFGSLPAIASAQPAPAPPPAAAGGAPAAPLDGPVAGPRGVRPPGPPPGRLAPAPLEGIVTLARPYHVRLRTADGRSVNVDLRNGTVITPLGTTLAPGMRVAVRGVPEPSTAFAADEIDLRVGPPPAPRGRARANPPAPSGLQAPPAAMPGAAGPPAAPPPPPQR